MSKQNLWGVSLDFYTDTSSFSLKAVKFLSPHSEHIPTLTHIGIRLNTGSPESDWTICAIPGSEYRIAPTQVVNRHSGSPFDSIYLGWSNMQPDEWMTYLNTFGNPSRLQAWGWALGLRKDPPITCVFAASRVIERINPQMTKKLNPPCIWPNTLYQRLTRW
jgi:hypothetical protein